MIQTRHLIITLMVFFLCACAAKKPYLREHPNITTEQTLSEKDIDYEVFLVGNIGDNNTNNVVGSDIVELIKAELIASDIPQSVVLLGNSINEAGFPKVNPTASHKMEMSLKNCVDVLSKETDKLYFLPGNREWFNGNDYRVSSVKKVERQLQKIAGDKNIFVPSHGCGKPKKVKLTDDLLLLIIDSQWILQGDQSEERTRKDCEINTEEELILYVQDMLARNKSKNVIIAAHHPVYSNGITAGSQPLSNQLIPFPIIGSLISGIKKVSGGPQRFGHPQYEAYREAIDDMLDDYEGVIFATAHENNLQSHFQEDNHYIIAGGGNKPDFVRNAGTAEFAYMKTGFAKITHTKDLELWLEFYVPDPDNPLKAKAVYQELLYKKPIIDFTDTTIYRPLSEYPETQKAVASKVYQEKKAGIGENYRMEWGTEVEAPVFLLEEFSGGVIPVRQGAGLETRSLRLEDDQGHQWILRTIDKDIVNVVPRILRKTFARDLVQDGISAAHPYGAFAIPRMAEAANIYHANPKFVWVPKQKALGDYNIGFGDKFYLFEERPGGNMEGHPNYGGAKKSISTIELIEKLSENHKHEIDQKYVLRARLFDLLIGDWDRDEDQWRWGMYPDESGDKITYRAIPRDRDQAFFKNDGFFYYIASRPYFYPGLRKFEKEIDHLPGLLFSARNFDRKFLSELTKADFVQITQELQSGITDEVIDNALRDWPVEIYNLHGEEIAGKLKYRRDNLAKIAEEFYVLLNKEITVTGTNGLNTFDITTRPDDQLEVKVYHLEEDQPNLIWSKTLNGKYCKELHLYGLEGSDTFNFWGEEDSSIKVRIVGGDGQDLVSNNAGGLDILAYDRKEGMQLTGKKVKSKLKNHLGINSFDQNEAQLDRSLQFPFFDFYTDEGLGITYNLLLKRYGFKKEPFRVNHKLTLGYYTANSAFIGTYNGHWASVFGLNWDFKIETEFTGPVFTQFFYGLGNEFKNFEEILMDEEGVDNTRFFAVRGTHVFVHPALVRDLGNNKSFSIQPLFEFLNIRNRPISSTNGQFIFLEQAGLTSFDFENKWYTGLGINYTSNRVYKRLLPTRGYSFDIGAKFRQSISDSKFRNLTLETSLQAYIPFSPTHKVVLATNIGAAYTFGEYEFFHANYLATRDRLRGFRRNRFAGDGIFYHATDLRVKVLQKPRGLRTGVGVFAAFDYGRAFLDGDGNDSIHTSYGGGFYLTLINWIGFKFGYYVGADDRQVVVGGSLSF